MANVLHKVTKQFLKSVNTPSYSGSEWLINPDISQTQNLPAAYWIIPDTGNVVTADIIKYRQDVLTNQVETIRDKLLTGGFTWHGYTFTSAPEDLANITAIVTSVSSGVPLPNGFGWRTVDNQVVSMSEYEVIDFGATAMNRINYIYGVSWFHKDNIRSLTTEAHLNSYNINLGWPPEVTG